MEKMLRSLIHEKIPEELRFQLELLSRKRNLINEEKHEKIIELFREFDIKGIVQLGPGTNRYAIKIDGYVLKIATDNDGKIDNLKEFKMAKRLYPYVTKTYEVSQNGTLLVAEYISPFSSYHEMTMYSDQIREILTKLSNTYLIGDVGITSKNYANWGLRPGSLEPVCLDFAYVYEVSSELFICRKCNSMLVPDRDFKRLNCSNTTCGQEYSFEDIRAKIGNDIHRHEIGDLTEEGYYLTASNVKTELNEQRSNYLARKKSKSSNNEHSNKLEMKTEEDTIMNKNIENNMAIASAVATTSKFEVPIIKASAVINDKVNDSTVKGNIIKATAVLAGPKTNVINEMTDEDLAFIGSIDNSATLGNVQTIKVPASNVEIIQAPSSVKITEDGSDILMTTPDVTKAKPVKRTKNDINDWFINNMERAFSKISNRISNCLHIQEQFDEVRLEIKNKMYPEEYYKIIQNAVFRSLVAFCNFTMDTVPNKKGNGTHKVFIPPTNIIGTAYEATMIFMARVWNNREINTTEDPYMMDSYKALYDDYVGIQREWLDILSKRISEKLQIPESGINKITRSIADMWCVPAECDIEEAIEEVEEVEEIETTEEPELTKIAVNIVGRYLSIIKIDEGYDYIIYSENFDELEGGVYDDLSISINEVLLIIIDDLKDSLFEGISEYEYIDYDDLQYRVETKDESYDDCSEDEEVEEESVEEDEEEFMTSDDDDEEIFEEDIVEDEEDEVAFSGSLGASVLQNPNNDDIDDETDEDSDDQLEFLSVEIYHEEDCDIIRINTEEYFGPVSIPFYTDLKSINGDEYTPSITDDRNGVWDWLIHMVPDLMFTTTDPSRWLEFNDVEPYNNQPHIVIMDEDHGVYTMGVYYLKGIYDIDEDGNMVPTFDEELLKKLNKLFRDDIGYTRISHLRRSLSNTDLIYDENDIMSEIFEAEDDSDNYKEAEENPVINAAENAAIEAILGDDIPDINSNDDSDEVSDTEHGEEDVVTFKPIRRNK